MTLWLKFFVHFAALSLAAPAAAQQEESSIETRLAQCIVEKDVGLAKAIQDAPSEAAFVEAIGKGVKLCPVDVKQLSMGRFFTALRSALAAWQAAAAGRN